MKGSGGNVPEAPVLAPGDRILPCEPGIDDTIHALMEGLTDSPVRLAQSPAEIATRFRTDLPYGGAPLPEVIGEIREASLANRRKNAHPGMYAYVAAPGLPTDPVGHAMVAALNQNVTGFRSAPAMTMIERIVIGWLAELAGMPKESDGLLLSGGSWSNLSALAVAVHSKLGSQSLEEGLARGPQPVILAAQSVHFSIQRAAKVLGIGTANVVPVALDPHHRMDVGDLRAKLAEIAAAPDRLACAVVATAGTTGVGAVDPLPEIAAACREAGVWMHVDAAYGGAALLAEELRGHLAGIGEADSITLDLHKWAYLAFDASALLLREPDKARRIFGFEADYVQPTDHQRPEDHVFYEFSPDLSRRARALPVYLAWRHYGIARLGRNISHNAACVRYLAELIDGAPDMDLVSRSDLSIASFRYSPPAMAGDDAGIDRLNEAIVERLDGSGDFTVSPLLVCSRPVIRVCVCSYATTAWHMRELVETVRKIGKERAA